VLLIIPNPFVLVLLVSSLACIITTAGIYIIEKFEKWANRNVAYFISFATGVLISVSFINIIPKSFEMNQNAPTFVLIGFFSLYMINRFINLYVCNKRDSKDLSIGIIPMIGIGIHSFIDGIIYSITFNTSIFTGILAATGMVLHEFPEGMVTFLLLERAGFKRKKSALFAFFAAALTTPLGALISFPLIHNICDETLGILLAISAGALVYVGATHLLPEVEKENKKYSVVSLGIGVLVAILIVISKG